MSQSESVKMMVDVAAVQDRQLEYITERAILRPQSWEPDSSETAIVVYTPVSFVNDPPDEVSTGDSIDCSVEVASLTLTHPLDGGLDDAQHTVTVRLTDDPINGEDLGGLLTAAYPSTATLGEWDIPDGNLQLKNYGDLSIDQQQWVGQPLYLVFYNGYLGLSRQTLQWRFTLEPG